MTVFALTTFLNSFADALDRDARTVSRSHAARLRRLADQLPPMNDVPQGRVPIQAACEAELAAHDQSAIARALATLLPFVHITRSKSYLANPPSSDFGENYGYGVICGPSSGPPALIKDPDIALGLMFLGPKTHYPLHHHRPTNSTTPLQAPPSGERARRTGPGAASMRSFTIRRGFLMRRSQRRGPWCFFTSGRATSKPMPLLFPTP